MTRISNAALGKSKWICHECVGEAFLSEEIRKSGRRHRCTYCTRQLKAISVNELAERVCVAFDQHFRRTSDQPTSLQRSMISDRESTYDWERDGLPVVEAIENAADIPSGAALDVQAILEHEHSDYDPSAPFEESEFDSESYYEKRETDESRWREAWAEFEKSIKTEARHFNRSATVHLASVFGGIDSMKAIDGRPLVVEGGPDSSLGVLFRARVFQSDERLEVALCRPDLHLGPPSSLNATAGRMNAHGISVFYGATLPTTAIAEVRPPVGSQVATAAFTIIRPVKLLDLTALGDVRETGSIFDPEIANRLERAAFLRSLGARIAKPIMPDDEAFNYLPTQAIADFLASENEPPFDGIVFPSVQARDNSMNVVLFHKAARIEPMELPEGTTVSASTGQMYEDCWEVSYEVTEEVPRRVHKKKHRRPLFDFEGFFSTHLDRDGRHSTLRVDLSSLKVHRVLRVEFKTDDHDVIRRRWVKSKPQF